ncbi:MAG TPA: 23S rRNA (pseudouridine(1915)-N(3))-methyltransferase RlmH, partial [Flavobacteriaceae bacterium]|nr:23S rRNA (pseudouridine(1915)-N(3))-methyltransferase RlmH [Flavobacteriaceae bacterium]
EGFAKEIENYQTQGVRSLVFLVGGAYGFSDEIYRTFPKKMRLSDLTFSHQMVRLFFCEQLYRAFTILNNHPYHNS